MTNTESNRDATDRRDAVVAVVAKSYLQVDPLKEDWLGVRRHMVSDLREALRVAYRAGERAGSATPARSARESAKRCEAAVARVAASHLQMAPHEGEDGEMFAARELGGREVREALRAAYEAGAAEAE